MNVMKALLTAAGLLSFATIGFAAPQSTPKVAPQATQPTAAPTTFNCLLASNAFAQKATNANAKALAEQSLYFYLGRIDAQITPQQLKDNLKRTADSLKGVNGVPLMNACVRELQTKGRMLQSVAQQLQQGK